MRLLRILAIGGSLSGLSWVLSRGNTGLFQAVTFMLALSVAVITLGLLINALMEILEERVGGEARRARRWHRRERDHDEMAQFGRTPVQQHCGSCRQPLDRIGSVWVCAVCDQAVVSA